MADNEFKPGDVVILKSGGPLMTVSSVAGQNVACSFFHKVGNDWGHCQSASVMAVTLRKATDLER